MGRRPRQASDPGYDHVVTRGNRRQPRDRQADSRRNMC